jgi:hypothetical protein
MSDHPKHVLYARAYDPLTGDWFDLLRRSEEPGQLLADAAHHDLEKNLERFNNLCRSLVDAILDPSRDGVAQIVDIVSTHRDSVTWTGGETPPDAVPSAAADADEIRRCLVAKLKRNISLGVVEALLCLESAYRFASDDRGLTGAPLRETLRRSRQLYGSLALLHDLQEQARLEGLAGVQGFLRYPDVNIRHVMRGELIIPADKFVVGGTAAEPRLKFVTIPVGHIVLDSPTKRCPADRHRVGTHGPSLNDELWDLLIDIYGASGRFN